MTAVTIEQRGHVLLMGLNRPEKRNAFNLAMIDELAAAYHRLETDDEIRCGVLFGHGDHFTGGLDIAEIWPLVREGRLDFCRPVSRAAWRSDGTMVITIVRALG